MTQAVFVFAIKLMTKSPDKVKHLQLILECPLIYRNEARGSSRYVRILGWFTLGFCYS